MSVPLLYLTGSEKHAAQLRAYAQALNANWTHSWFETGSKKPDQPLEWVAAIKRAWKGVLILPHASDLDDIMFELGVMSASNYFVCVMYQDESVRQRLLTFLPRIKVTFYKEFEHLKAHIDRWSQDLCQADYWD